MKLVKTIEAIGYVLCHDITRIVPGKTKGPAFRKGHIIKEEDIDTLLGMGKEHIYVWEDLPGMIHENDAAGILCDICQGANVERSEVKEGKIEFSASIEGLFKVKRELLNRINSVGQIVIAARHGNFPVKSGDILAGARVIPLLIEEMTMQEAKELSGGHPILNVLPFKQKKAGLIITGSEIFHGMISDAFTPVLESKLAEYDVLIAIRDVLGDDDEKISDACVKMINRGIDVVICAGGMSVDPDDRTPLAIKNTEANVVSYGVPVLPGSMFMLAYYDGPFGEVPIVGLPGCVIYNRRSIFDLVLPRIMADDRVSREDLVLLGNGGLCLNCVECVFPRCGFGKGN